jgi:hypothetical protein
MADFGTQPGLQFWEEIMLIEESHNLVPRASAVILRVISNLAPRAMPVRGLGWHWFWGN